MDLTDLTVDKLVTIYRRIRDTIKDREREHAAEIDALKIQMDLVSAKLLGICNEQNVDSLRTKTGTITRRTVTRYWTSDWESMYSFIKEQDAPHLLEQRIHSTNMRDFLEENPDVTPIGLNTDTKYAITVRKPSAKA
jgi:hypothetical protein